jgi:hypothetical protein
MWLTIELKLKVSQEKSRRAARVGATTEAGAKSTPSVVACDYFA